MAHYAKKLEWFGYVAQIYNKHLLLAENRPF